MTFSQWPRILNTFENVYFQIHNSVRIPLRTLCSDPRPIFFFQVELFVFLVFNLVYAIVGLVLVFCFRVLFCWFVCCFRILHINLPSEI